MGSRSAQAAAHGLLEDRPGFVAVLLLPLGIEAGLAQRLAEGDEKHGSIIIPDSAKEKPQEGKVIAVGTGKVTDEGKKIPLDVKAGDRILFGKYSGSEVKLDGQEYLTMREEDVLGILSA